MKKFMSTLLVALMIAVAGCESANSSSATSSIDSSTVVDYGTLTIEDINLKVNEDKEITPVFSKDEGREEVNYTFDGENISIVNGVVKGLVADTETIVTATTSKLETTFKVKVVKSSPLGHNTYTNTSGTSAFKEVEAAVFEKITDPYQETFLYQEGVAIAGSKYMASGSIELSDASDYGQGVVQAKYDETHFVRFVLEYLPGGSYQIFTDYKNNSDQFNGYRKIKTDVPSKIDFDLVVVDDMFYFFVDDLLVGKVQQDIGNTHAGFGGEKSITTLSNLSGTFDEAVIDAKLAPLAVNFSVHGYGNAGSDNGAFVKQEDGSFKKESTTYKQQFYYEDGIAIAGSAFTIKGRMELLGTTPWSQALILLTIDDNNMFRYVYERTDDGKYQLFSDRKVAGNFGNWQLVLSPAARENYIDFAVAVKDGTNYLFINDELVSKINIDLGLSHVGFASDKGAMVLSDLQGSLDASRVDKVISNTPFDYNIYTNATDTNVFTRDEDGRFVKTSTDYRQTFYYEDDEPVAGSKYMMSGTMEITNPIHTQQGVLLLMHDESHMVRFVIERWESNMQIFTDHKNDSGFQGWKLIKSAKVDSYIMNFTVIVDGSKIYFLLDDVLVYGVEINIGESHVGFAGEKGTMILSNLEGCTDEVLIDAKIIEITQN